MKNQGANTKPRAARSPAVVIGYEKYSRVCGHVDDFKIIKGEPPAYTTGRRAKWDKKLCAICKVAADAKIKAEAAERRAASPRPNQQKFRLPSGSSFAVSYVAVDASHGHWSGTLTVPGCEPITCEPRDGVHGLLRRLGFMWWSTQK